MPEPITAPSINVPQSFDAELDTALDETQPDVPETTGDDAEADAAESSDTEAEVETADDADAEPSTDEAEAETDEASGKFPKELSQLLKGQPKLLDQVKKVFFQNQKVKELFGGFKQAEQIAEAITSFGGLAQIEKDFQEMNAVDQMWANGDPGLIDHFTKEAPDGFVKIMSPALDKFRELDPNSWNHEMAKVFTSTIISAQVPQALDTLLAQVKGNPEAETVVANLQKFFEYIGQLGNNAPKRDLDPQFKKLEEARKKIESDRKDIADQKRAGKIVPTINSHVDKGLAPFLKGKKLDTEAVNDLKSDVHREFQKLLGKDERFQQQKEALLKAGEDERFLKLATSRIEKFMPLAIKNITRKYNMLSGNAKVENTTRKATVQSQNKELKMTEPTPSGGGKVDPSDIDWRKTSQDMWLFDNTYYSKKDGKLHKA